MQYRKNSFNSNSHPIKQTSTFETTYFLEVVVYVRDLQNRQGKLIIAFSKNYSLKDILLTHFHVAVEMIYVAILFEFLLFRFYYDKSAKKCRRFRYGGCRGKQDNFATREDCIKACKSK